MVSDEVKYISFIIYDENSLPHCSASLSNSLRSIKNRKKMIRVAHAKE
jgi:hypothetical protein